MVTLAAESIETIATTVEGGGGSDTGCLPSSERDLQWRTGGLVWKGGGGLN